MLNNPHCFRLYTEIQRFSPVKAEISSVCSFQIAKKCLPKSRALSVSLRGYFYSHLTVAQGMLPTDHASLQESLQFHQTRRRFSLLNQHTVEIIGFCPRAATRRMNRVRKKLQLVRTLFLPPLPPFLFLLQQPLLRTFGDWHAYSTRIQAKLGKKLALPVTLVNHSARFEIGGLARVDRIRCTTSSSSGLRGKNPSGQK